MQTQEKSKLEQWRLKFKGFKNKIEISEHFDSVKHLFIGVIATVVILYICGFVYSLLSGDNSNYILTAWLLAIRDQIASYFKKEPLHNWVAIIISGFIPLFLYCYHRFIYKKYSRDAVRWLILGILTLLIWLWMSSIALSCFVSHSLLWESPFAYVRILLSPYSKNLHQSLINAGIVGTVISLFIFAFLIRNKAQNIYGDAHFANYAETRKAGLFGNSGIILGMAFNKYLYMDGYEHVTLFSPSGTGKTVGLTIPNLLSWTGSSVVSDIKLTLFQHTSAYRKSIGQQVFLWNPGSTEGKTHCYNPLDIISDNCYTRIDEIQKIASIFIPDNPKSEPIWQVQSRFLFVALVLYVLDTPDIPKNIGEVVKIVKAQKNFVAFIENVVKTRSDIDHLCKYNFMKFAELHDKTRLSILATFQSYFELFDNPLVAAATHKSDFDIRKLRHVPTTIYVGVTPDNLVRLAPLLTVFYQQVADVLTRNVPTKEEKCGVMLLMDEFSALRRMESFHKNIGLYREYKVRVVIIIQELSQLYDTYGRDGAKVFINAKVRVAFTQNDEETCRLLEAVLGNKTALSKNQSRKLSHGIFYSEHRTEADHYVSRPLMAAQEIRLMSDNDEIILVQGNLPVKAKKIAYFRDKQFASKIFEPIKLPSTIFYMEEMLKKDAVLMAEATKKELDEENINVEVQTEIATKRAEEKRKERKMLENEV
jgi:type IV secretion system protein VirD4